MQTDTVKRAPKPKKVEIVQSLAEKVGRARGIYFTEFKGLTVAEMTELRRLCRQGHVDYVVCKNTFARRVMREQGLADAVQHLQGPTGLALGYGDPALPARILSDFAAKNEKLVLKGGVFEGRAIGARDIQAIRSLPSRELALAMVVGALASPLQGFYNVVSGVLRDFVSVIDQIGQKKTAA